MFAWVWEISNSNFHPISEAHWLNLGHSQLSLGRATQKILPEL